MAKGLQSRQSRKPTAKVEDCVIDAFRKAHFGYIENCFRHYLLHQRRLSRDSLADVLGLKPTAMSEFLNGVKNLGRDRLFSAAAEFGFNFELVHNSQDAALTALRAALEEAARSVLHDNPARKQSLTFLSMTYLHYWTGEQWSNDGYGFWGQRLSMHNSAIEFCQRYRQEHGAWPEDKSSFTDNEAVGLLREWGPSWWIVDETLPFTWPIDVLWPCRLLPPIQTVAGQGNAL